MKADLLLIIDHLARPCGIRTTYFKLFEWCESHGISIALLSDNDEELPFKSIVARLTISVNDTAKIGDVKRRPFLALLDENRSIHPDIISHGINYDLAYALDAWNGDRDWFVETEKKCRQFVDSISVKQVFVATQSFLGFATSFILNEKKTSICLHTHYAAFYAIRIAGEENALFKMLKDRITQRLEEVIISKAQHIFLVSEASRHFFNLKETTNLQIFEPGVDTQLFKPTNRPITKKFRCLYAGRWSKDKGTDIFVELFKSIEDVEWVVTGNESDLKTPANVRALGTLDQFLLAREMANADIVIFHGKWDTFGLVGLEALSCGVPVLAYQGSEISKIIENRCGYSFSTITELVGLVRMIKESKNNFGELRLEARRTAEEMTWDKSIRNFIEKIL